MGCIECGHILACNGGAQPKGTPWDQPKYLGSKFYKEDAFEREMERNNPHLTTFEHMPRGMCPFFLLGLIELLLRAECYIDHLWLTSCQRNDATVQLVQTELIQPTVSQHLPTTVAERSQLEYRQMRHLFIERPQGKRFKWVATMWVHWLDAYGAYYPQGWQAAMRRMKELVD